ncbi:DUF2194 domain-containing protein [Paenibacillus abyssi]|uniref:Membrane protein n=1 Tax=Paenibacillus abyssi TaxID=1340531 RepID=A0A917CMD4_9BACL|nr:DUF2194 domain-containing protein [Paenibacillus abyssi]GGF92541.1 membrane protein [Paenibacillus abyssi]
MKRNSKLQSASKIRLKHNVYIILSGVLLLAIAIQITHSQSILRIDGSTASAKRESGWKPAFVEPAALQPSGAPYCIAFDSSNEESARLKNNAERVLQYMKKPVRVFDMSARGIELPGCQAAIIALSELNKLGNIDELARYVESGGYAFLMSRPELEDAFYRIYRKLGINDIGDASAQQGIMLHDNVLIGESGLALDETFMNNFVNHVQLDNTARLLASTANRTPLLWEYAYGGGKFMVFNGSMLAEKYNRGIVAGAISLLEPDFIYPVFNAKLMYIDDFPAPVPTGLNPSIYRTYKRDISRFFRDIWWPDMIKLARQADLKYTAVVIQTYTDHVEPPFDQPIDQDQNGLIIYGREVLKSGGEIGIHGYNHQSLQTNPDIADNYGYNTWSSMEAMAASIEEVVSYVGEALSGYQLLSYVPPSNMLDEVGREALKKSWPSLAVISSLYGEDQSGMSYIQEFEVAPDGILEMPRITSGYFERPFDRWAEANTITSIGVFSHFIHPDDIMDEIRSNHLSWDQLYDSFLQLLKRIDRMYPWLRASTSAEAAIAVESVLTSRVDLNRDGNAITGQITPFKEEAHFILRTSRKIGLTKNSEAKKIDKDTYLVKVHKAGFEIRLGR